MKAIMNKRRLTAILIMMALISALLYPTTIGIVPSYAAEKEGVVISVDNASAKAGSSVDVNIKIQNNTGILGGSIIISYDDSLTLNGAVTGSAFSNLTMSKPGKFKSSCTFVWDGMDEEAIDDGTILTLNFSIREGAKSGSKLPVRIQSNEGDFIDGNLNPVDVSFENGYVMISSITMGDVNDDGRVNTTDLTLIRRSIAGGYDVEINATAADMNGDGRLSAADLTLLRRYIAGGYDISIPPTEPTDICAHSMSKMESRAATCTEDGNIEAYICAKCGKYFSDIDGTNEISIDSIVEKAKGHTEVIDPAVEATETTTGLTEGKHCSVCNKVLVKQEETPILNINSFQINYHITGSDQYLQNLTIENTNPKYWTSSVAGKRLKELSVDGYDFEGWYDGSGSSAEQIKYLPAETKDDIDLYAKWSKVKYSINFNSPLAPMDSITYTVDKGVTLANPEWYGYTFVGWTDESGNLIKRIKPGSIGNITLTANWTSIRNQTIANDYKSDKPTIIEDKEAGKIKFIYYIGRIENVPLYETKEPFQSTGLEITETETVTKSVEKQFLDEATEMVSSATTQSDSWTLSEEWNSTTTKSEEHASEVSKAQIESAETHHSTSGTWQISSGRGGTKATTVSDKTSSTVSKEISAKLGVGSKMSVGAEASLPLSIPLGVKTETEFTSNFELAGKKGTVDTKEKFKSVNNTSNWNTSACYSKSNSSSSSKSSTEELRKTISDVYGISQTQGHNKMNSSTSQIATSRGESRSYKTSLAYDTGEVTTKVRTISNTNAPYGWYRITCAGTIHTFAVVEYDLESNTYCTYALNELDDKTYDFIDYSKNTSSFDDYENGVLPFEVPYFVNEYVSTVLAESDSLRINTETGIVTGYTGSEANVIVPQYTVVENDNGSNEIVEIKGISENAFRGNENLKYLKLPSSITEIPDNAFKGCSSLKKIVGTELTRIGNHAFDGCVSLEDYSIDESVVKLGESAFVGVNKLTVTTTETNVADAVYGSGAKNILLDISKLSTNYNNREIVIPAGTELFNLNGKSGTTYQGVSIESKAKETTISNMSLVSTSGFALKASSQRVNLNKSKLSSPYFPLIMTNNDATLGVYGTIYVESTKGNGSILARTTNLTESKKGYDGKLSLGGDAYICGKLHDHNLLCEKNGYVIKEDITESEYETLLSGDFTNIEDSDESFEACFVTEAEYNELYKDNPKFKATPYYSYSERTKEYTTNGHDTLSSDNGNPWTKYDSTTTTTTSGWTFTKPVEGTTYPSGKKRVTSIANTSAYYYWYAAANPHNTSDWCYFVDNSRSDVISYMKKHFGSTAYAENRLRYFWYISSTINTAGLPNKGKTLNYHADSTVSKGTLSSSGTYVTKSTGYNYSGTLYYYGKVYKAKYVDTVNKFWRWGKWSSWSGYSTDKKTTGDNRQEKRMYWIEKANS